MISLSTKVSGEPGPADPKVAREVFGEGSRALGPAGTTAAMARGGAVSEPREAASDRRT